MFLNKKVHFVLNVYTQKTTYFPLRFYIQKTRQVALRLYTQKEWTLGYVFISKMYRILYFDT